MGAIISLMSDCRFFVFLEGFYLLLVLFQLLSASQPFLFLVLLVTRSNTRVFPKCYTEFFISFLLFSWFDISEKCSRHLDACCSHPVRNSPFLSPTGLFLLHLLFANTVVILYNSLFSLFYAASSAFFVYPSSVIPSHTLHNFFIRIRVVHFLFSRFADIYSFCNFLPSGNFIPCFLRSPFFFFCVLVSFHIFKCV